MGAQLTGPGQPQVGPWGERGRPTEESEHYLGIIEQRCQLETSGAAWFIDRVRARGGEDRFDALRATLLDYRDRMHSNEPVHRWD